MPVIAVIAFMGALFVREVTYLAVQHHQEKQIVQVQKANAGHVTEVDINKSNAQGLP